MGMVGVFAYLIEMYIRPQDWAPFMYAFPLVTVIASLTLIIALFYFARRGNSVLLPQVYFIIVYLVLVLLSNVFNGDAGFGFQQLIEYAKRASLFFAILFILEHSKQLKMVFQLIVFLSVILSIQVMLQSKYGIGVQGQVFRGPEGNRVSWIGAWDGPNVLCLLFVLAIALSLGFVSRTYKIHYRIINLVFIGFLLQGVYLTNSRGGYIGLLVVVAFFLWDKIIRGKRLSIKLCSLLLICLLGSVVLQLGPSRVSELNSKESSAHERTWLWEQALNETRERPVFGVGKGQFYASSHAFAHNNFVQNMVEMGLPGLFIYMCLVYLSLKGLFIIIRQKSISPKNAELRSLVYALFVSMIGYIVVTFFVTMELDILFVWFGLCAATVNIAKNEMDDLSLRFSLKDAGVVVVGMIAVIFVIYLVAVKEIL